MTSASGSQGAAGPGAGRASRPGTVAPFGSWATPITSELVVAAAVRLSDVQVDGSGAGAAVVWSEGRPDEGGRTQLVRRLPDGSTADLLPAGFDARSAVHEYGGAAWTVHDGVVRFVNWADQRIYRLAGSDPQPLTPEPETPRADRYADWDLCPDGSWMVAVREHHPPEGDGATGAADVRNEIVRLDADLPSEPAVLVSGPDFVASPRLSPDGRVLAWVSWDHPSMPWDDTVLTIRDLDTGEETIVAGGPGESVSEPRWQPDGALTFLSDRTGWWNLYRWLPGEDISVLVRIDAEIGVPGWTLGSSRYAVLPDGRTVFARWSRGYDGLALRERDGTVRELGLPFSAIGVVRAAGPGRVVAVAGTPAEEPGVHLVELDGIRSFPFTFVTGSGPAVAPTVTALRPPRSLGIDPAFWSVPEPISFPSVDAVGAPRTAHALFYAPTNPGFRGPDGAAPPLLVVIHGGPTGAAAPVLNLGVQYWTSRGFGVVDVNYGGSTGFGRDYRELLKGAWGIVDVADCLAAARHLADPGRADPGRSDPSRADRGRVDGTRMAIRGGSAGGYTTLAALAREDTPFTAGADHFGVADLEALAADTHKFESRYLDGLVGPYPQAREVYVERSPIHHVERFSRPLIVLQGAEDAIVPPNQSERIVEALRKRGVAVAYLLFDGEQHGFRRAENIRRALDAELSFYAQVFGFPLPEAEGIAEVPIENLGRVP